MLDIFFLNREPMRHVTKFRRTYTHVFAVPPAGIASRNLYLNFIQCVNNLQYKIGPTPIVRVLRHVLREKQLEAQERKLLTFNRYGWCTNK